MKDNKSRLFQRFSWSKSLVLLGFLAVIASFFGNRSLVPKPEILTQREVKMQPNEWQFRQRAYPRGELDMRAYKKAQEFRSKKLKAKATRTKNDLADNTWKFAGPENIGGRITDIEINQAEKIYVAAASGGVFTSTDEGANWTPIFDEQMTLSIGDMALAPSNEDIIYVGTGEPNAGGGSLAYDGLGVFKSTDAGMNWTSLGLENIGSVGKLVVDANDPDRVFVAAMGPLFKNSSDRGVYRSIDGGANWQKVLFQNDSTGFIDLAINPNQPDTLFAAAWERIRRPNRRKYGGPSSGVFRSFDGGNTWTELTMGLPDSAGRIGIAIAPSAPNIIYANYTDPITNSLLGLFKSIDHGDTWASLDITSIDAVPYMWWFGKIFVDPLDAEIIYLTSLEMFRSSDGGNSWGKIFDGAHVDQHAIGINPTNTDQVFLGNDGGVYLSMDGGSDFSKINNLPITQFYTVEIDESLPERLYGGTQDNGTNRTLTGGLADWEKIYGGDGFYVLVNPDDNDIIYAEYQNGGLVKSIDGGTSFVFGTNGIIGSRRGWNSPVVFHPNDPSILYFGASNLFKTEDAAENWTAISPDLTQGGTSGNVRFGVLTTVSVSPLNTQIIYTGADDGTLSVTRDGGTSWNTVSSSLPNRWITRVVADSIRVNGAYVTYSGYRFGENIGHIYKTLNRGTSWMDITGDLPDVPINDLIQTPHDGNLYIATDIGVFYSENEGVNWELFGKEIPNLVITDLDYHAATKTLVAASYGRGLYKISLLPEIASSLEQPWNRISLAVKPNPVQDFFEVKFQVEKQQQIRLELLDAKGALLEVLKEESIPGGEQLLRFGIGRFPAGIYIVRIKMESGEQGNVKIIKR